MGNKPNGSLMSESCAGKLRVFFMAGKQPNFARLKGVRAKSGATTFHGKVHSVINSKPCFRLEKRRQEKWPDGIRFHFTPLDWKKSEIHSIYLLTMGEWKVIYRKSNKKPKL